MTSLSAFPPELVSNIFAFVRRNDDQKRCCLVNRMFRDLMLPILWKTLRTDLCCDDGSFDVLVDPKSNIITNMKTFMLLRHGRSRTFVDGQRDRLMVLLAALPRDTLRYFKSNVLFDNNMFRAVLQSQKLLEDIDVPLCEASSEQAAWSPYLTMAEFITCWLTEDAAKAATAFKHYWPLLQQAPNLEFLSICSGYTGTSTGHLTDISLLQWPAAGGEARKYALTPLKLMGLSLGNRHTLIFDHINFETLTKFILVKCVDCQPMLEALTKTYATGTCVLKDLSICLPKDISEGAQNICRTVEGLLLSFKGLMTLFLNLGRAGLVSKESVNNHSRTLKCLAIGACQPLPIAYEASDLSTILNSCTVLTQLAITIGIGNIRWEGLCHRILDINGPYTDVVQISRVRDTLVCCPKQYKAPEPINSSTLTDDLIEQIAIASHPSIHSLRIMDPAFLDWNGDGTAFNWTQKTLPEKNIEVAAVALQNLATQILQLMCQNGSRIRAIAWIPSSLSSKAKLPVDSNGHRWGRYAYFKGHLVDAHGVHKVVAIPVDNINREMQESSIFFMR